MGALPKEEPYYTYNDYTEWELDEGERYQIIYGDAYAMAAPGTRHQIILGVLFNKIFNYLEGKICKVISSPFDVRPFYRADGMDDTVVQPDIVVICDEKKLAPEGCRGAPDLVIEILSPSNTAMEMYLKLEMYHKAGVREYWVVDPGTNTITVYCFQKDFSKTKSYSITDTITSAILPGLSITLDRVFA